MVVTSLASECTVYSCLPGSTWRVKKLALRSLPSSVSPSRTMKPMAAPLKALGRKKTTSALPGSGVPMAALAASAAATATGAASWAETGVMNTEAASSKAVLSDFMVFSRWVEWTDGLLRFGRIGNGRIGGDRRQGFGAGRNDDLGAGDEHRHQAGIGDETCRHGGIGSVLAGIGRGQGLQRAQRDALAMEVEVAGGDDEFAAAAAQAGFLHMDYFSGGRRAFGHDDLADLQIFRQEEADFGVLDRNLRRHLIGEHEQHGGFGGEHRR